MQEKLGAHILWHVPVLGPVHGDTIVTTWLVMVLALLFFGWVGASYRSAYQTRRQVVVEGVVNYIADLATSTLGPKGEPFVPFFIALFVFIFLMNQFGMLPFKAFGLPFGGSPTADLNTTVPLALSCSSSPGSSASHDRLGADPAPLQAPSAALSRQRHRRGRTSGRRSRRACSSIFSSASCFSSSSLRSSSAKVTIGALNLSLAVAVLPFFIQFFNFFVGTIQAFVFTLLAIVYLSLSISDDH